MKTLIFFVSIFAIIFLSSCKKEETPTSSKAITYSISLSKTGNGTVEIVPSKTQYDVEEEVTLHAYPDSQWLFERWEGSILTNENPILIKMDRDKSIKTIFTKIPITYKPDITGNWFGLQWAVDLVLTQPSEYDSTFSGKAIIRTTAGDTLFYSVTGYNTPPKVKMNWVRAQYYHIVYTGEWQGSNLIYGALLENGVTLNLDFGRENLPTNLNNRRKINFGKKISYE